MAKIETVRLWLTSVMMVSMLLSLVRILTPKGSVQKIGSFTGGLVMLLALLRPLVRIDLSELIPDLELHRNVVSERQEELIWEEENRLVQSIAQRTSAYISDKAESLGVEASARVKIVFSTEGIPLPVEAEITGAYVPELAAYIEQDLGIPAERQVWREEEN